MQRSGVRLPSTPPSTALLVPGACGAVVFRLGPALPHAVLVLIEPGPMASPLYTPELANKSLPLVRRIAEELSSVSKRLQDVMPRYRDRPDDDELYFEFEHLRERFAALLAELDELGVEVKDPLSGLLDFRARRGDGQVVYLCWRLGEEGVFHWHTIESGFAGRRPLAEF
jgi:hypothetical protein